MKKGLTIAVVLALGLLLGLGVTSLGIRRCSESDGTDAWCIDDDEEIHFGDGLDIDMALFTDDANAAYLGLSFSAGGSVHVPVFGIGITLDGVDLGQFNGQTQPLFFIADADDDSFFTITYSADDTLTIGVQGSATAITFVDAINFGVTDVGVDGKFWGDTAGDYALFDASADKAIFEDYSIHVMDDTTVIFGDDSDVTMQYDEDGDNDLQVTGPITYEGAVALQSTLTMTGTAHVWNPGSLTDGTQTSSDVTVSGLALGDWVGVGAGVDVQDQLVSVTVTAANTATIVLQNETGGTIDLASATWYIYYILDD